jgi:hypothetical protein
MKTIAVIGHRDLYKQKIYQYKQIIFKTLKKLRVKYNNLKLITPLADGSDRIIVYEALRLNIVFEVVLPMKQNEYKKDFNFNSKKEFDKLLKQSNGMKTLKYKYKVSRDYKYENVGRYISDNCDFLIALWDGKYNNLQGGTGEIVKYHLNQNKKLIHIKVDINSI